MKRNKPAGYNLPKAQMGAQTGVSIPQLEAFIESELSYTTDTDAIAEKVSDLYGIDYYTALNVIDDVITDNPELMVPLAEEANLVPDQEEYFDEDTFGKRYEYPTLNEESMAMDETQWGWDDSEAEDSLLNEETPTGKRGGSMPKNKFVKKVVKGLRKAADGMEQDANQATTNDTPVNGRNELVKNFRRGVKDLGNKYYAEQMYDQMRSMPQPEDIAQWGGARRTARQAARDWRRAFGKIPVGMFGPGVPNYLGFIVPQQGQPQIPIQQPMVNPFGVNMSYTRRPFRGSTMTIENLPLFPFMPMQSPGYTTRSYTYPGEVIRERVPVENTVVTEEKKEETKQIGGMVSNPMRNQYGSLQKFIGGGYDMPDPVYNAYSVNDMDTKDVTDPYFMDGGLMKAQDGVINVSPFSYHGNTPGMYRFGTQNPTFNIGYTQPLGTRARNAIGADYVSAGLTSMLPYKNNTGVGIQGDLHTDYFNNFHTVPVRTETDVNIGYDPNMGGYGNIMASPQFLFGNVSPTMAKMYGTGLKQGDFLGSVGPFAGASVTPGRERREERFSIPAGVRGNIDFGLGRKGVRAGLSGYAGADMMGMGLEKNKELMDQMKAKFNYGIQANLKIPIKPARDFARDLFSRMTSNDRTPDYVPKIKHGGLNKFQGTGDSQQTAGRQSYDEYLRKKAEAEALAEYNEYMNSTGDGSQTMVNYAADPNDPVYQRILNSKLASYQSESNTQQNTQQVQQQQGAYPYPATPYSTGFSRNPWQDIKGMFSPFKQNPYTGQNYDFMWMSQQGPTRTGSGEIYKPPAGTQQGTTQGQGAQGNVDYLSRAMEDLGVTKEQYEAAKAAYGSGQLYPGTTDKKTDFNTITPEQQKQIDLINRVEEHSNKLKSDATQQQFPDPTQPGYRTNIELTKGPWWKGNPMTLKTTNKWYDPNNPSQPQNPTNAQENMSNLNPRSQRVLNRKENFGNWNLFAKKNKQDGGDISSDSLYQFQGLGDSQVNDQASIANDPNVNNMGINPTCTDSEKMDPNSPCYDANFKPDIVNEYKLKKARTLDTRNISTGIRALNYGIKGIFDAADNVYQDDYLNANTTSDNMKGVNYLDFTGGVSGLTQRPAGAPRFTGVVGSNAYAKAGGQMSYQKGGEYDLTMEEIGAILAAGGQIEFI